MKLSLLAAIFGLVCYFGGVESARATVFRDRAAFNAASQNVHTIDFESEPVTEALRSPIDGVVFQSGGGPPAIVAGPNGKLLLSRTVIEFTFIRIFLPPDTTAVGVDQFSTPMIVEIAGESVTMNASDNSTFVGFISDQPIESITISFDFPEPTPSAFIDNLSFGQRRVGNEPPVPQLLTSDTGRAAVLDSATTESEPFHLTSPHNLSTDPRTRLTLFVVGVVLEPADAPFVTVQAEDAQQNTFNLPVEATARSSGVSWVSQVTVRLPDVLNAAGNINVSVTVRGKVSNKAPIRID